jgi:hypothetical protein
MLGDVLQQRLGVLRQLEEPAALLVEPLDRPLVDRALPLFAFFDELALRVERLAADAVPALVRREVEVVGVDLADPLPQRGDDLLVVLARRADEPVALDAERLPHLVEARRDLIDELLRREPALLRRFLDLLPVLVRAGQEPGVIATHPMKPRERIAHDRRVRVPEVRYVVDVVDGSRDVERRGHRTRRPCHSNARASI